MEESFAGAEASKWAFPEVRLPLALPLALPKWAFPEVRLPPKFNC